MLRNHRVSRFLSIYCSTVSEVPSVAVTNTQNKILFYFIIQDDLERLMKGLGTEHGAGSSSEDASSPPPQIVVEETTSS